jgi:hypothetical protein
MSLLLLIVLGFPLVILAGQIVGAIIGFVFTLAFHGIRGLLRYLVVGTIRKVIAKKELHGPTC